MQIQIPRLVYEKVMYWVRTADHEVSGFGKCTWYPDTKVLYVHDAELLDYGSAAETEIDAESVSDYIHSTIKDPGDVRWWWHSHVDMQVFWSGTDKKNIEEFARHGWLAATVFNKRAEMRSAIVAKSTVQSDLGSSDTLQWYDDLATYVIDDIPDEAITAWAAQLEAVKAARKKPEPTTVPWLNQSAWWENDTLKAPSLNELPIEQDEGLLGYGLVKEAKAIGMEASEMRGILDSRDFYLITELEEQLTKAEKQGAFNGTN